MPVKLKKRVQAKCKRNGIAMAAHMRKLLEDDLDA
jgi:hypothetical protein